MMHGSRRFVTPARQPCQTPSHRTAKLRHVCCVDLRNYACICTTSMCRRGYQESEAPSCNACLLLCCLPQRPKNGLHRF